MQCFISRTPLTSKFGCHYHLITSLPFAFIRLLQVSTAQYIFSKPTTLLMTIEHHFGTGRFFNSIARVRLKLSIGLWGYPRQLPASFAHPACHIHRTWSVVRFEFKDIIGYPRLATGISNFAVIGVSITLNGPACGWEGGKGTEGDSSIILGRRRRKM